MPRGRPRKGLSRMDAAVDAMNKFGFEKDLVRKHVKELLGEYGGDVGWPFIEDCSYKELLDAILREQETDNLVNVAEDGDQIEDKPGLDEELAGPSNMASDTVKQPQGDAPLETAEPICPGANGWKDIHTNQTAENHASENDQESPRKEQVAENHTSDNGQESPRKEQSFPSIISTEIPPRQATTRKCLHFYGWVDRYEEEDDDFIILRPSSMVLGPPPKEATPGKCLNGEMRKRRTRWDVRPGDKNMEIDYGEN